MCKQEAVEFVDIDFNFCKKVSDDLSERIVYDDSAISNSDKVEQLKVKKQEEIIEEVKLQVEIAKNEIQPLPSAPILIENDGGDVNLKQAIQQEPISAKDVSYQFLEVKRDARQESQGKISSSIFRSENSH